MISVARAGAAVQDGRMPPSRLHADQVDIDEAMARRLIAAQLPRYARLPLHRVQSGGTENAVFRLGSALALRMPLTPGAVGSLLSEVRWLPVVAQHVSLDVPEVVATGSPDEGYPFPWAVLTWLPGQDALTGRFRSLVNTATALGRFVAELRSIDATGPVGGRGGPLVRRDGEFRKHCRNATVCSTSAGRRRSGTTRSPRRCGTDRRCGCTPT